MRIYTVICVASMGCQHPISDIFGIDDFGEVKSSMLQESSYDDDIIGYGISSDGEVYEIGSISFDAILISTSSYHCSDAKDDLGTLAELTQDLLLELNGSSDPAAACQAMSAIQAHYDVREEVRSYPFHRISFNVDTFVYEGIQTGPVDAIGSYLKRSQACGKTWDDATCSFIERDCSDDVYKRIEGTVNLESIALSATGTFAGELINDEGENTPLDIDLNLERCTLPSMESIIYY